jgi:hypothetical protein
MATEFRPSPSVSVSRETKSASIEYSEAQTPATESGPDWDGACQTLDGEGCGNQFKPGKTNDHRD